MPTIPTCVCRSGWLGLPRLPIQPRYVLTFGALSLQMFNGKSNIYLSTEVPANTMTAETTLETLQLYDCPLHVDYLKKDRLHRSLCLSFVGGMWYSCKTVGANCCLVAKFRYPHPSRKVCYLHLTAPLSSFTSTHYIGKCAPMWKWISSEMSGHPLALRKHCSFL